jgi:hypothetical protein
VHAFTVGAALVGVLRWLAECAERAARDGPCGLHRRVALTINRGKREGAFPDIKRAVQTMLESAGAPFRWALDEGGRTRMRRCARRSGADGGNRRRWTDGWTDGRMDRWMDGRMDG